MCEREGKRGEVASIEIVLFFEFPHTHTQTQCVLHAYTHENIRSHIHRGEEDRTRSNTEAIKAVVSDC